MSDLIGHLSNHQRNQKSMSFFRIFSMGTKYKHKEFSKFFMSKLVRVILFGSLWGLNT